jgi:hypothetical protein
MDKPISNQMLASLIKSIAYKYEIINMKIDISQDIGDKFLLMMLSNKAVLEMVKEGTLDVAITIEEDQREIAAKAFKESSFDELIKMLTHSFISLKGTINHRSKVLRLIQALSEIDNDLNKQVLELDKLKYLAAIRNELKR